MIFRYDQIIMNTETVLNVDAPCFYPNEDKRIPLRRSQGRERVHELPSEIIRKMRTECSIALSTVSETCESLGKVLNNFVDIETVRPELLEDFDIMSNKLCRMVMGMSEFLSFCREIQRANKVEDRPNSPLKRGEDF